MVNEEEPVQKALMASPSAAITSEDSVNSNLVTLMVDSGASGYHFDDAIILNLKNRLHDYAHLTTPRKSLSTRRTLLNGRVARPCRRR